jgi:hypothetical protein
MASRAKKPPVHPPEFKIFHFIFQAPYTQERLQVAMRRLAVTGNYEQGKKVLSQLPDVLTPHLKNMFDSVPWPSETTQRTVDLEQPYGHKLLLALLPGRPPVSIRYASEIEKANDGKMPFDISVAWLIEGYWEDPNAVRFIANAIPSPLPKTPPDGLKDSRPLASVLPDICDALNKKTRIDMGAVLLD